MNRMVVKDMVLDIGRPKIAVSLVGRNHEEIAEECRAAVKTPCDMLEWRVDYYLADKSNPAAMIDSGDIYAEIIRILDDIDYITDGMPVIFSIRSKGEGGQIQLSRGQVFDLMALAAQSQLIQFADIEIFNSGGMFDRDEVCRQVDEIHGFGCRVIMSYHNLDEMPTHEDIFRLVGIMRSTGADISKVAAKASTKADAVNILKCSEELTKGDAEPVILIGMGAEGIVTRVVGGQYGSVISFAAGSRSAAPGQIKIESLEKLISEYYRRNPAG